MRFLKKRSQKLISVFKSPVKVNLILCFPNISDYYCHIYVLDFKTTESQSQYPMYI